MGQPTGPIYVDFGPAIMRLPIENVVLLANLALNRMKLSDLAEVSFHAGLQIDFALSSTKADNA